jgi:signal transduction histidine kinase
MGIVDLIASRQHYDARSSPRDSMGMDFDGGICAFFGNPGPGRSTFSNLDACGEERRDERTRIARELHDTLLQGFLGASMQLHAAVDNLPSEYAEKQRFSDVLQLMNRALEQGRSALQGLRSPEEGVTSLGEVFAGVQTDLGLASGVDFRVVVHGKEKRLRAGPRDEVYRIGREAIVNAYRHSHARDIETEVEFRPTELRIAVRDNGCGIDPQELQWERNGHWGLQGMRERAERIGARLRLFSRVALGTEVELCVPGRVAFEQTQGRACRDKGRLPRT